jgi:hypothetical protein
VPHEIDASHIISLKLQIQKGWIEIPPANWFSYEKPRHIKQMVC